MTVDSVMIQGVTAQSLCVPTLREVYDAQLGYVYATLRRLGVAEKDRKDVAHDVFIVVSRRLAEFDASRPLKPWLFGITFRVAIAHKRLARNDREVLGEVEIEDDARMDVALEATERRELVERALAGVPMERRPVLIMHDVDGAAMSEIAATLGIPVNTAYSRLRLARQDFSAAHARLVAARENAARLRRRANEEHV